MSQLDETKMEQSDKCEKITMVLLGKNSNDKYMVGNSIVKAENLSTKKDTCTKAEEKVGDRIICIINTPELFHEQNTKQETDDLEELKPQYPGERAFLLVLRDNPLSQEDMEIFTKLKERFGEKMVEKTIVVLVSSKSKHSEAVYEHADENLKKLLDECGRRMFIHNRNEGMKDNELTKQVMENWKTIYEKPYQGASNSIPLNERTYEEIDQYTIMTAAPGTSAHSKEQTVQASEGERIMTVVLLGMHSDRKNLIGNMLFNKDHFRSKQIGRSCEKIVDNVNGQKVCIINTPDSFHKVISGPDSMEELKPSYTGPCVFLLVLKNKRVSQEEMNMYNELKKELGSRMVQSTVVLIEKDSSSMEKNITFSKYNTILNECGNKKCVYSRNMKSAELIEELKKYTEGLQKPQTSESDEIGTRDNMAKAQTPDKSEQTGQTSEGEHKTTVVLLGKNSKNKCLIGNKIFNKEHFQSEKSTCQKIVDDVDGQKVCIIRTTDSFHKGSSEDDSMEELKPSYTGSRVFLLILKSKNVPAEEMDMYNRLKKKLGTEMVQNTIVMVKNKKKKGSSTSKEKNTSSNSMERKPSIKGNYEKILKECGNKKCAYYKDMKNEELIEELKKHTESEQKQQTSESDTERTQGNMMAMQTPVQQGKTKPITIVLLGQTGSGKSATGNTILKKHHFESHASSVPVTKECQVAEETVFEKKIRVIDTPDFFDEDLENKEEQIKKCKELAQPGPDLYLLVMQLGRFTDGEREVLPHLKKEFGDDVTSKIIILFTGKEKLKDKSLMDYIRGSDKELQELVKDCQSRCYALNNNEKDHHQVKKFLKSVDIMQGNIYIGNDHKRKKNDNKECKVL